MRTLSGCQRRFDVAQPEPLCHLLRDRGREPDALDTRECDGGIHRIARDLLSNPVIEDYSISK
jgi:hypothetical protein